ncbi:type 2 lanthipeptide synthetase LanM family protein [Halorussus salinus]|uniref:type 2 lanthipeptide synthetase LanM family protein n=1 Tax=Halorussus salinus TaxID=1364935 RepID=UPI001091BD5A|nr:type 2 lanthipeptide synthetase LanM family protein [Halorussus salinus]
MPSLTEEQRAALAGRARTLHERLDAPAETRPGGTVDDVDAVLDAWRDQLADGDPDRFRARLDALGLSRDDCRERLQSNAWPDDEPLPDWVATVEEVSSFVAEVAPSSVESPDSERELPFEEVVGAIVAAARSRLDDEAVEETLTDAALADFEVALAERVEHVVAHPLFVEFKTFVAHHDRELALADDPPEPDDPRNYYEAFVAGALDDGLREFFVEYAFLSRLLASILDQWVATVEEFCGRLARDAPELAERFGDDGEGSGDDERLGGDEGLGDVTRIDVVGDYHEGGRASLRVGFSSGVTLAYKPREMRVTSAFYDLLAWVNDQSRTEQSSANSSGLPELRTLDCLAREEYGWLEWAETDECATAEEVERFYRRAGVLIAMLYALRFGDGHADNVVAAGDQPVVVDAETLAEPEIPPERAPHMDRAVKRVADESVVGTGLIPTTDAAGAGEAGGDGAASGGGSAGGDGGTSGDDGATGDESDATGDGGPTNVGTGAFAVVDDETGGVREPVFSEVNTDLMEMDYRRVAEGSVSNLPELRGDETRPADHADRIAAGFEEGYRLLESRRDDLLADDGPLSAFEDCEVRVVYRETAKYAAVLESLRTPEYLRTGLQFGCKSEALLTLFADADTGFDYEPLYRAELDALARLDVPRFGASTDDTALYWDGERCVEELFDRTPYESMRERIRGLGDEDLAEQREYVRYAFDPETRSHGGRATEPTPDETALDPDDATFERAARDCYDRLVDAAVEGRDGDPTWLVRENRPEGVSVDTLPDDLYRGRLGVALFAAALARTADEPRFAEFAEEVADPVADAVSAESVADLPLGVTGIGSVVYGFTKLGDLLDADEYVRVAETAASALTPEKIRSDGAYDLLGGSAGAILGLLALHDETGSAEVVERATTAGDHLLAERADADGVPAWHSAVDGQPLTGLSHGVSGIALALVRLGAVSDDRFAEAGVESLAFERRHYSPDERNWRDLRPAFDGEFGDAWCNGRSGIGLARLGMAADGRGGSLDAEERRDLRDEARDALAGVEAETLQGNDHLCCGNFGRVAFLNRAGTDLGDAEYRRDARRLAAASVARADRERQFRARWQTDHWHNPSLFGGEAGIGYELLRLVDPSLPCVLLLE